MAAYAILRSLADELDDMLDRFKRDSDGLWIAEGDQARYIGIALEATDIFDQTLGPLSSFRTQLDTARIQGISSFSGTRSFQSIADSIEIIRSAAKAIQRGADNPSPSASISAPPYVNLQRIEALRSLSSSQWDFRRLVRLCEEINGAFREGNLFATALLLRAIADHVPPIFGAKSFADYANSIVAKSHKGSMQHLQVSLRNIADGLLHNQIRTRETLPSATQVDFRQDLDVLLGEILRVV